MSTAVQGSWQRFWFRGASCQVQAAEIPTPAWPVMCGLSELQLLVIRLGMKRVRPLNCRGISYSLRPQQISYVLPGKDYTPEDLQSIFLQANAQAADHTLMETAWEVVQACQNPPYKCNTD